MEVWVEALVAHLVDLLHIVGHHVLQELLHVGFRVDALQLLLVEIQHFVNSPFELELENKMQIIFAGNLLEISSNLYSGIK